MQNLTQTISKNLAKLRLQNRLSLDKLSERSGVSKAMLSQIEHGESNPTVNTLWKIATGLRVSFYDLLQEDRQEIELVRHASCPLINDTANGLSLFSLFPFKSDKPFEVFTAKLQPQCTHFASPHAVGSEEYVLLSKGALYIHVNNTDYKLQGGDALRFPPTSLITITIPDSRSFLFIACSTMPAHKTDRAWQQELAKRGLFF